MIYRRHMHEFGTTTEHFGSWSRSPSARNAARNPHARDARADHARRPSGVALDRRAAASARLLPGDRRRLRGDHHLGRARPRLPAAAGLHPRRRARPKGRSTSRWPTTWRTGSRHTAGHYVAEQLYGMARRAAQRRRRGDVLRSLQPRGPPQPRGLRLLRAAAARRVRRRRRARLAGRLDCPSTRTVAVSPKPTSTATTTSSKACGRSAARRRRQVADCRAGAW